VTTREMLRATANYLEKGHGSFGQDRASSLRALADRMDAEFERAKYPAKDATYVAAGVLARLDAAPSQSGDAK